MAKFKDTEKSKKYIAKKPINKQLKSKSRLIFNILTLLNIILVIYLIFNK